MGIEFETTILLWVAGMGKAVLDVKALAIAPAKTRPKTDTRIISFIVWLPLVNFVSYELV
jgi:hypothetical protein